MMNKDFAQKFYLIVNALILNNERKILMLFSKKVGGWSLPGGKVEQGEHPVEGLIREVEEETGLHIRPIELLGAVDYNFRADSYSVNLLYKAEYIGGKMGNKEPDKHTDMGYRDINDLPVVFKELVLKSGILSN